MIKYSIIIPFYNVEDYIIECAESINKQKYKNYEAIFIDDGSKDNTRIKLEEYLSKNKNKKIRIETKENGGLSDARNYGIKLAKGKYLIFIDSDDFIDDNMLEKIDKTIKNNDIDLLVFDFYEYYNKEKLIYTKGIKGEKINKHNLLISPPAAWNKVYKKEIFIENEIEYSKGLWYEDLATTPRLLTKCQKIKYLNEPLYYYRQRENSIMNSFNTKVFDMYKVLEIVYEYYKNNNYLNSYYSEIENIFILNTYFVVNKLAKNKIDNKLELQKEAIKFLNNYFPKWYNNRYYKKMSFVNKNTIKIMKYKSLLKFYNTFINWR